MDKKLMEIFESYGLEIITDTNNPRFIKGTSFNAKSLISDIIPKDNINETPQRRDREISIVSYGNHSTMINAIMTSGDRSPALKGNIQFNGGTFNSAVIGEFNEKVVINNNGEEKTTSEEIDWTKIESELTEFIQKTDSELMKEVSKEALEAVNKKDFNMLKKVLASAGKVGLEVFSKVTGTVLAEFAKSMMTKP